MCSIVQELIRHKKVHFAQKSVEYQAAVLRDETKTFSRHAPEDAQVKKWFPNAILVSSAHPFI